MSAMVTLPRLVTSNEKVTCSPALAKLSPFVSANTARSDIASAANPATTGVVVDDGGESTGVGPPGSTPVAVAVFTIGPPLSTSAWLTT